jgi:hypothetical protein
MRVFISTSLAYLVCLNLSLGQNKTIVINEFMFDPSPRVALPEVEYVELMNISDDIIHLSGWTLNEHLIPEYSIKPDEILIICESASVEQFSSLINVLGMDKWDRLNNTGQAIYLKDNYSNIMDSLVYTGKWIPDPSKSDGGWSLELINPMKICSNKDNWAFSTYFDGGTPGYQNSVYNISPDRSSPYIINAKCLDSLSIQLSFSETVNFSNLNPSEIFHIQPGQIQFDIIYRSYTNVQVLKVNEALDPGKLYNLHIKNIADCENNYLDDTLIQVGIGENPLFNDVLITELLIDETPSQGLPESEYIEILNNSNKLLNLHNMYLFSEGKIYEFPDLQLLPDSYYLLIPLSKAEIFTDYMNIIIMERFPKLHNDGKMLGLYNRLTGLVFSLEYNKEWYKDSGKSLGGYSIEMIDIMNPCGGINNWTSSEAEIGGTPGTTNSVYINNPDLSSPTITEAYAFEKERITIHFNEKLHPDSFKNLTLIVDDRNIPNGWNYDSISLNRIEIDVPWTYEGQNQYTLKLTGIKDCVGNFMKEDGTSFIIHIPVEADPGDVVINEVLFNPKPGGTDWIEIINVSDKYVDIKNWYISHDKAHNDDLLFLISNDHHIMEPNSYWILTANINKVISDFPHTKKEQSFEMSEFPQLPDSEGYISLWTPGGLKMDELSYQHEQHNIFLNNPEGVSLERISPFEPAFENDNWQSASSESGYGTPTNRNSQYQLINDNNFEISISPTVFSPDQDGHDDYLNIALSNQDPGYVANIHIFDISGQVVKKLTNGYLLGTNDNISWDGYLDNGQTAKPGHYILLLEMFHPNGNASRYKRKFIVGRRF